MFVVSRSPFRVSFFGGGSDFPAFYQEEPGMVVSAAVNKYMYVIVKNRIDSKIRLNYSESEIVDHPGELKHDIARAILEYLQVDGSLEITSLADIPAGTGMGSSSAYAVSLLNALAPQADPNKLAETACYIELDVCKKPIGKQDQYIISHGGFNTIKFSNDGVYVKKISCSEETLRELENKLIFFYTGTSRKVESILKNTSLDKSGIRELVQMAEEFAKQLQRNTLSDLGRMLKISWDIKKKLARGITNEFIDNCYDRAVKCGAAGKLLGAGGGGTLMFYTEDKDALIKALGDLVPFSVKIEPEGSKVTSL